MKRESCKERSHTNWCLCEQRSPRLLDACTHLATCLRSVKEVPSPAIPYINAPVTCLKRKEREREERKRRRKKRRKEKKRIKKKELGDDVILTMIFKKNMIINIICDNDKGDLKYLVFYKEGSYFTDYFQILNHISLRTKFNVSASL